MRSLRFWILLVGSLFVCGLYLEQIYLSREIYQQQRVLMGIQQFISLAPRYEESWKQLASRIYQVSQKDAALADVLKRNQIEVQFSKTASSAAPAPSQPVAPAQAPVPATAPTSSKAKTPVGP